MEARFLFQMKTIAIAIALFIATSATMAATVVFNLRDFIQRTEGLQRKIFAVKPLTTVKGNTTNLVIVSELRYWNTGTNSQVTATNMVAGLYNCYLYGNTWTSVFRINVIDTNGTLYASDLITSTSSTALDLEDGTPLDIE